MQTSCSFVHTALEEIGSFRQLHNRLPLARPIQARYWRVPAAEVLHEREALIQWQYGWWERIDEWIDEHAPASAAGWRSPVLSGQVSVTVPWDSH